MNLKKIIAILSFLLLLNCGYEPIYSKKQINSNYSFSINTINYIGDNKVNQILKNQLQKILNKEKKSSELNLNLNSRVEKIVTSKDKKGNPKRFSIKIIINLEVYESEILKGKANFEENFEYNNRSNKFNLKKYEKNIQDNFKSSVILRPSIVFGPEDKFFNTFASIAQFSPFLPLVGGGKTKFAPIYVGDVAKSIVKALELNNSEPKIYELGGPKNYSFKELMEILLTEIKKKRLLIPIPFGVAKFQSYFLQMMPNPLLTPDQVELLKHNNIVSGDHPTLKDLGITGTSIQSILPKYIYRFKTFGQFG